MAGQSSVLTRRRLLGAVALGGIGAVAARLGVAETPSLTAGPFYPLERPLEHDADLARVAGADAPAEGELMHLAGRVLDARGRPIAAATVEIWHADSHGRYHHPHDRNPVGRDARFQGYGLSRTDAEGRYRFRTVKPAPYAVGGGMRAPHVHFQVTGGGERRVTQMFFPGEPLNEDDFVLQGARGDRELLFARIDRARDALDASFDVVIVRS